MIIRKFSKTLPETEAILINLLRFKQCKTVLLQRNKPALIADMRVIAVIILFLLITPSCNKDNQPLIPYVYVSLQLYPNSLDYIPVGGYRYQDGGYRGIVIYRFLPDQFMVYERCCPYDPEQTNARVTVDPSGSTCIDSTCMSKFILFDGTPYDGPSPYSLMQYRYTYNGEVLYIYN